MINRKLRVACLFFTIIYFFSGIVAPVFADVTYSYDANGNMTSDGTNCYTYNDANQLSKVTNCTTGQTIAEYIYDYQGNRIEKKVYSGGNLQKTVYSPDKSFETVKQASGGTPTTGIWTTGSASSWAAVIVSFNSSGFTPALMQKQKGFNGGTGSVSTSFTNNVTSGNTIIVMTVTGSSSNYDTTSVTDSQNNTYTQIGTSQQTAAGTYIQMWYAKDVTGGAVTVTSHQSGSASGCLMEILEYSGLSTTAPADQSASATGNSTSPSGGSITPTNNNALVISAFTDDNNDNVSITGTNGYTVEESDEINSTSSRNGIEDQVVTSGAATSNTSYYYVNDELAAQKNPDGSKYYVLSDNLGSTSVLTDQNGNVVEYSTYYPFGQIRSGGTQSKYLYTGQQNDQETNLDYYNARYYDPSIQHFTQPDSELPNVYDPQQLNRYAYVRNNPMTVTDPTGHLLEKLLPLAIIGYIWVGTHPDQAEAALYATASFLQTGRDLINGNYNSALVDAASGLVSYTGVRIKAPGEVETPSSTSNMSNDGTNQNMSQEEINQAAQQIGQGHAFNKHVIRNGEFDNLRIKTQDQFISHINGVMSNPSDVRSLDNGRTGYLDTNTGTVVIHDPINGVKKGEYGTALIPDDPIDWFYNKIH